MKKIIAIILLGLFASGCSVQKTTVFNEWYNANVHPTGFRSYDPPDGDWIFISNEPGGAMLKRTQDWDWHSGKPPKF